MIARAPTRGSDAARNRSDPAKRPGVQPKVPLEWRVPSVVARRAVPVEPRLVGHPGSLLQKRQGIRANRIAYLLAVALDDVANRLARHERRHRIAKRGGMESPEATFV